MVMYLNNLLIFQLNFNDRMQEGEKTNNEAFDLLASSQELKLARSDSSKFLKKLADHPFLLRDMLDIGLRPTSFQKAKGCCLTADMPALAIDALVSLYEDFIDLLAFDRILPKDRALEGLQMQQEESEQASQQHQLPVKQEFRLLMHIHQGILQGEPEETAYYYLCRLIGPLSYQRPVELMRFYKQKPEVMATIIQKMDQRAIIELFCKTLECESGKQFFKEYKKDYLTAYFRKLKQALNQQGQQNWLEGLQQLYRFLTEKMDEVCEAKKYLNLLQTINDLDLDVLKTISKSIQEVSEYSCLHCLRWIEEMLKHDSYIMGQSNVRLTITFMNRKNSISNNFYNDDRDDSNRIYHISEAHLLEILSLLRQTYHQYLMKEAQKSNILIVISFYRILYFFTKVWNQKGKEKQLAQPSLLTHLINQPFFDSALQNAMKHPRSTILHNCIKELFIECIREGILAPAYFYRTDCPCLQLLIAAFPRSRQNQSLPFSQQLYHIYKEVVVADPHINTQVQNRVLEQSQRMSKLIGGDPRKLHADTLRGSSNAFSESSENLDDMLQFDLHSGHSLNLIGSAKSYGSGVVKVHATVSIQRSELQEVGEERIVIEGVDDEDDD